MLLKRFMKPSASINLLEIWSVITWSWKTAVLWLGFFKACSPTISSPLTLAGTKTHKKSSLSMMYARSKKTKKQRHSTGNHRRWKYFWPCEYDACRPRWEFHTDRSACLGVSSLNGILHLKLHTELIRISGSYCAQCSLVRFAVKKSLSSVSLDVTHYST